MQKIGAEFHATPAPGSGFPSEPVVAAILAYGGVQRVPNPKVELFVRKQFLEPDLCTAIVAQIEAKRRPSTISDYNGDDAFRTSETCDLPDLDPDVLTVDCRISRLTGLLPTHGEPMQGQRYAVGQEFKGHTDYFEPQGTDYEKYCSVSGQRTWTVMIYLNDVDAGGATRFKAIDKLIQPEAGKLVAWNNLRPDGRVNPSTIHHGMKVRSGVKYVVTKWYRERIWPR